MFRQLSEHVPKIFQTYSKPIPKYNGELKAQLLESVDPIYLTTIKNMYKGYRKYTLGAKKLATYNRVKFSLDEMTKQFGKILDKHVPEFPQEVKLQLPKLKKVGSAELPKIKLPKLKKV